MDAEVSPLQLAPENQDGDARNFQVSGDSSRLDRAPAWDRIILLQYNAYAMRPLPAAQTLRRAVECVIESNTADGYPPTRFRQMTMDGTASNLVEVCRNLINKGELLELLERELEKRPTLLTIEDFVCRYGSEWGFDATTISMADARRVRFDQVANQTRYA
jgi:hypothetical protein